MRSGFTEKSSTLISCSRTEQRAFVSIIDSFQVRNKEGQSFHIVTATRLEFIRVRKQTGERRSSEELVELTAFGGLLMFSHLRKEYRGYPGFFRCGHEAPEIMAGDMLFVPFSATDSYQAIRPEVVGLRAQFIRLPSSPELHRRTKSALPGCTRRKIVSLFALSLGRWSRRIPQGCLPKICFGLCPPAS